MTDKKEQSLNEKLAYIQVNLKAPKSQFNNFGKYNYRNCEDILEALKPLLAETKTFLVISDEIVQIGERYYVKAEVRLSQRDKEFEISTAFAREPENKKGMDVAQITGATSSYARKYALNGLFAIDDTRDPDTQNNREPLETQMETQMETQQEDDKTDAIQRAKRNAAKTPEAVDITAETNVLNYIIESLAPKVEGGNIIDIERLKSAILEKYGQLPTKNQSGGVVVQYILSELGIDKVSTKNDFIAGLE